MHSGANSGSARWALSSLPVPLFKRRTNKRRLLYLTARNLRQSSGFVRHLNESANDECANDRRSRHLARRSTALTPHAQDPNSPYMLLVFSPFQHPPSHPIHQPLCCFQKLLTLFLPNLSTDPSYRWIAGRMLEMLLH